MLEVTHEVVVELSGLCEQFTHCIVVATSCKEEGAASVPCEQLVPQPTDSIGVDIAVDTGPHSKQFTSGCGCGTASGTIVGVA